MDAIEREIPLEPVGWKVAGGSNPEVVVGALAEAAVEAVHLVEDAAVDDGGDDVDMAVEQQFRVDPAGQFGRDAFRRRAAKRGRGGKVALRVGMPEFESAVNDAGIRMLAKVLQLGCQFAGQPDVVGIEKGEPIRPGVRHREIAGGGGAAVVIAEYLDARIDGGGDVGRAIRGAVIDQDDFEVVDLLAEDADQRFFNIGGAVVRRHDDREQQF